MKTGLIYLSLCFALVFTSLLAGQEKDDKKNGETPSISSDYSDLVFVKDNVYLAVNDRKNPIHPGNRLTLITIIPKVDDHETVYPVAINIDDWKHEDGEASDLEACCAIPGCEDEFLIAESGYYKGKFGRIFHIKLNSDAKSATVLGVRKIYNHVLNDKKHSYKGNHVEGIGCFNALGKTYLVYGQRGGDTPPGEDKRGKIIWGELDLPSLEFTKLGESHLATQSILGDRDCSTLHLHHNDDQTITVYSAATTDPDPPHKEPDFGPFRSKVYEAGRFEFADGTLRFFYRTNLKCIEHLGGIKVEGLTDRPNFLGKYGRFLISTDDEHFGGVLRLIGKPETKSP